MFNCFQRVTMQAFVQNSNVSSLKRPSKQINDNQQPGALHMHNAFQAMDIMRKDRLFCDVTLVTKNVEILAHKVVLASCSQYFYRIFTSMEPQYRVNFEEIEPETLYLLIDYIYTSELQVTHKNVQELLAGATILVLTAVKDNCSKYLTSQIRPENCLRIMAVGQEYDCIGLVKNCQSYINKHFTDIVDSKEFLMLPFDQVSELISSNNLATPSEEKVYESVMTWVKYDLKERKEYLSFLMKNVRIPLISRDYLVKRVINEPILKADINCKDLIIQALLQDNIPNIAGLKRRQRSSSGKTLLVMGGYSAEAEGSLEFYNFIENTWSQVYAMPLRRRGTSLVVVNEKVYVVGRNDLTRPVNAISEYDVVNNRWHNFINTTTSRTYHGVAVLNDSIYVVGGRNNQGRLNTAEKFDIKTQKWTNIATMATKRSWVGVGVLNNLLYAIGGYADYSCPISAVECYNPQADVWKSVSSMNTPRSGPAIGVLHNRIYAMGGHDDYQSLSTVEIYSPEADEWASVASMNIPRRCASVVVANDLLYIIGGWDGNSDLTSIEVYNPKHDSWVLLSTQMNIPRSSHGSVVIDKISDEQI